MPVVLLVGRAQLVISSSVRITGIDSNSFYEGHTMDLVTFATRVCKVMGVETIIGAFSRLNRMSELSDPMYIVTNAAGGLNQDYAVGDIVCLNDVQMPISGLVAIQLLTFAC